MSVYPFGDTDNEYATEMIRLRQQLKMLAIAARYTIRCKGDAESLRNLEHAVSTIPYFESVTRPTKDQ